MKGNSMSSKPDRNQNDDMRPEYDLHGGVRGRFFNEYRKGNNIVLLDSDVASVFPDSTTVNQALRLLIQLAERKAVAGTKQRASNKALQPAQKTRR
jgi:hypothetical protein